MFREALFAVKLVSQFFFTFLRDGRLLEFFEPRNWKRANPFKIETYEILPNLGTKSSLDALRLTVITVHIFHEDFVEEIIESLKTLPPVFQILATCKNGLIASSFSNALDEIGVRYEIRVTRNQGRNFGPLLVEFREKILQFEYVVHVHSKKTKQLNVDQAQSWRSRSTKLLATKEGLLECLAIFQADSRIGLIFAASFELYRGINFRWGPNLRIAKRLNFESQLFNSLDSSSWQVFPAGGMFVCRVHLLDKLLTKEWNYEDFPLENGQTDFTTQHAVERLVGRFCEVSGKRILAFDDTLKRFELYSHK